MSGHALPAIALSNHRAANTARAARPGWFASVSRALRAIESRRLLREMEPRMLSDIGVGRAEALAEADRAPWDLAPTHRD